MGETAGGPTSLAFNKTGTPGIAYNRGLNIEYAYLLNGQWNTMPVTMPVGQMSSSYSLAFDPTLDTPCISFRGLSTTSGALMFAYLNNGQWITEMVDNIGTSIFGAGTDCSLAFNPRTGAPSISYEDYSRGALKFASRDSITRQWQTEAIDIGGPYNSVGAWSSLAFDTFGVPNISYYGGDNEVLRHATQVYGKWYTATVDNGNDVGRTGWYTSIKIDPKADTPCIGYIAYPNNNDYTNSAVKFAYVA